ncbi:MAG: hypothetical protein WCL50_08040, partial [Spirochaetota bacterium]
MLRTIALTALISIGCLAFAQASDEPDTDLEIVIPIPERVLDRAGLVLKRAESALEKARAKLERRGFRIVLLQSED